MAREELYRKGTSMGIPSDVELLQVKRLLREHVKKGDHVLVLGATAELRNIALGLGCKVIAVDISIDMINKRDGLVKAERLGGDINIDNNVVAKGNWLSPWFLRENSFKAVIGDASFNNLLYDDMISLFGVLKTLVRKDGVLIFRHANFYDDLLPIEVAELYKKNVIDKKQLGMSLYFNKRLKHRKYVGKKVMMCESIDALIALSKKAGIKKEIQKFFENHKFPGHHTILDEKDFNALLMKHFGNYKAHVTDKVLYGKAVPIYLIRFGEL